MMVTLMAKVVKEKKSKSFDFKRIHVGEGCQGAGFEEFLKG